MRSLRDTTFVVVDLETTGGRATGDGDNVDAITEIGAVKVRGGEVLGELATLVDPGRSIPPQIVALTGITSAMVCNAPKIDSVLPAFLEFARGAVLVAHNAGFDIGFLRAAAERCQIAWPRPPVLCTVRLARRVLTRDEAPSVRLSALARLFGAATTPTHRALDDARATVDVLHGLIERVGNQGVHTYTDLRSYLPDVTPEQRRKRVLAEPAAPARRLPVPRTRRRGALRRHGGGSAQTGRPVLQRRRPADAHQGDGRAGHRGRPRRVRARPGGGVRELRLLAAHAPPYNRRSKFPQRWWWIVLTDEAFPRFSIVRRPKRDSAVGPFRSRADAVETADLLARFTGVRTCTTRMARSAHHGPACPEREPRRARRPATSPPPTTRRAAARVGLIDGRERTRTVGGARPHHRAGRAQPLRDRRAAA